MGELIDLVWEVKGSFCEKGNVWTPGYVFQAEGIECANAEVYFFLTAL